MLGWLGTENKSQSEGCSGVELIEAGIDAFAIRKALIEQAERSIDLQYYIWHDDLTGALLLRYVRDAAAGGVRIRLLLDDNGIEGLDETLRWMASLPNIDVRLFNPFRTRWFKPLDFLFRFSRANRRMHTKSFTVDRAATIMGGRNVGDEYFAAKEEGVFADLDALCVGAVVKDVCDRFEEFWTSPLAVPIEQLIKPVAPDRAASIANELAERISGPDFAQYAAQAAEAPMLERVEHEGIAFTWEPMRLVSDPPEKVVGEYPRASSLLGELTRIIGEPAHELLIVSGYFVPTDRGARALAEMARRGVEVQILTNSYAATDVGLVHAGYARHRRALVEAGVRLFEVPAPHDQPKTARKLVTGIPRKKIAQPGPTLHAKSFSIDTKRVFVGSMNFDPRSFWLNTELGVVIDSAVMARAMQARFEDAIAKNSYRLVVERDRLGWIDERDDHPQVEFVEPGTNVGSRLLVWIFGRLRIDWLL